ncbi:hypothetical protein [Helicobacter sp. T3_23-1056]
MAIYNQKATKSVIFGNLGLWIATNLLTQIRGNDDSLGFAHPLNPPPQGRGKSLRFTYNDNRFQLR